MTKVGGISWNKSPKSKQGVRTRFYCRHCNRAYKMDWARKRHEGMCPLRRNPLR